MRFVFGCVLASALCVAGPAEAASPAQPPPPPPARGGKVTWQWPRFHPAEYVATAAHLSAALALRFGANWDSRPNWVGGFALDEPFYRSAHVENYDSRKAWDIAGDIAFYTSFLWSTADPIIAGFTHSWDVGGQMMLLNLEGYATFSTLLWGSQYLLRRRRPTDTACDRKDMPGRTDRCDDAESVRAFIGGHTGTVATAASLTCLHHSYMPLYGGGFRDVFPCALWIAGTMVTFTSRSVTGSHYLSDNLFGVGIGGLSGFVIPWALHYARGPGPWSQRPPYAEPRVGAVWLAAPEHGEGTTVHVAGSW